MRACNIVISGCSRNVVVGNRLNKNASQKETFNGLWKSLEKHGITLPLKAKMLELNEAYLGFKHYETLSDPQEAVTYYIY